jgi:uncharacterized protein YdiU (UPF0061 family)
MSENFISQLKLQLKNSYLDLPEAFYQKISATPVALPSILKINEELADFLNLDINKLKSPESIQFFSGNQIPNNISTIALAYAGHQFGNFVPQLGDGRALLLGEYCGKDQKWYDLQLKGSGPTRFSRRGDGRSALGPVIREFLVSEAMFKLQIPTTRSLLMLRTGEDVIREQSEPGGILCRVASSHLRIGSLEYVAHDETLLKTICDYAIQRHDPDLIKNQDRYFEFFKRVKSRQIQLISHWLRVGFIHGVMNTDNTSLNGETIDYGPCAFLEEYHPHQVYSFIDRHGRYAYINQPMILQWNLAKLAEAMLPLFADSPDEAIQKAQAEINSVPNEFKDQWAKTFCAKIGFQEVNPENLNLVETFLNLLQKYKIDFTLGFRRLADCLTGSPHVLTSLFSETQPIADFIKSWQEKLKHLDPVKIQNKMNQINPIFIPRNHWIEKIIQESVEKQHDALLDEFYLALQDPYSENPTFNKFYSPAQPTEKVKTTFCGT